MLYFDDMFSSFRFFAVFCYLYYFILVYKRMKCGMFSALWSRLLVAKYIILAAEIGMQRRIIPRMCYGKWLEASCSSGGPGYSKIYGW